MILRLKEITAFVHEHIIPLCQKHRIFTFTGPLGAGKTTLIRETLKQLGVPDTITSPTFGYLKNYQTSHNISIHHFDLYRINALADFIIAGFDEYLTQPNSISFVEWPEVINQLLSSPNITPTIITISLAYHQTDQEVRVVELIVNQP